MSTRFSGATRRRSHPLASLKINVAAKRRQRVTLLTATLCGRIRGANINVSLVLIERCRARAGAKAAHGTSPAPSFPDGQAP